MVEIGDGGERTLVRVKAHKRRRILKVTASDEFFRIRLADPARLKAQGFRFRNVAPDKAKGLTLPERRAIKDANGRVIVAFKGPRRKPSAVKVQAILLPRSEEQK